MIFDRRADLKYHQYKEPAFLVQGVIVDMLECNKKHIKNQPEKDIVSNQISLKEYMELFMSSKNTKT